VTNKVGRPLKFETPDDLQCAIDAYFKATPFLELTVTGLALSIGTNRQSLINYENIDDYADIIKRAKCRIENSYEISLRKNGRSGDIFALKNFGWRDKQDHEMTGKDGKDLSPQVIIIQGKSTETHS